LKINKDKDVKKEKSKEKEKELENTQREESKYKNKEINKQLDYSSKEKLKKKRKSQDYDKKRVKDKVVKSGINTIIINSKNKKNFNSYKGVEVSLSSENMDDNDNKDNENNKKMRKKSPSLKNKKTKKEKHNIRNENKNLIYKIEEENNTKNIIKYNNPKKNERKVKNSKKIDDISSSWKMSVESFTPNNFDSSYLESHYSEIDSPNTKKIEKKISHQNTQNLKFSPQEKIKTNEICQKNDYNYNSLIKVKRANNRKKLGEVSSDFQISQRVSNLYIYSQRVNNQNDKKNNNNNVICPGNFISFEYNLNGGKENNTTRDLRLKKIENNHIIINNNKLNNIMLKEESIKNINNEIVNKDINVNVNNSKDENDNKKKSKKKLCLCCL
jgi:DnaJ family protein A protein 5